MRRICVFTGTRAEYGLLCPLMRLLQSDPSVDMSLLVSGMHLSPEFGLTVHEIEQDGFCVDERVEMLVSSQSDLGVCKSMGLGMVGLSEAIARLSPDILVVLGDRYEAFVAAACATVLRVPIAHLHGGEATFGLTDEAMRHSISKMSHLHFTSTEPYRRRVIQLGEQPETVFNVGAVGLDRLDGAELPSRGDLASFTGLSPSRPFFLVTLHPETLSLGASERCELLLSVLNCFSEHQVLFTKANADVEGCLINERLEQYVQGRCGEAALFASLGDSRYLAALKHADVVIGNSSSGIIEAPSVGTPTVDIGDRQAGRIRASTVVHAEWAHGAIMQAIRRALSLAGEGVEPKNPYWQGGAARQIMDILAHHPVDSLLFKQFHDLGCGQGQPSAATTSEVSE